MSKNKSDKFSPADLDTPTDLSPEAVEKISAAVNPLIADAFALYLKTKNFHWHISGRHFRDYHLMLDEQGEAIFATIDELAERIRKIGGTTMRSIGHVAKLKTIKDNDETYVPPREMLRELMEDNKKTVVNMRKAHDIADKYNDFSDDEHSGEFHRRGRAPHLVSVRSQPPGRQQRGIGQFCGKSYPRRPGLVPGRLRDPDQGRDSGTSAH